MGPEWVYWVLAVVTFLGVSFFGWLHPSDYRLHKHRRKQLRKWLGCSLAMGLLCCSGESFSSGIEAPATADIPKASTDETPGASSVEPVGREVWSSKPDGAEHGNEAQVQQRPDAGTPAADGGAGAIMLPNDGGSEHDSGAAASLPACLERTLANCCATGATRLTCQVGAVCRCWTDENYREQGEFRYWCAGETSDAEGLCSENG